MVSHPEEMKPSEKKLQTELNLSWIVCRSEDPPGAALKDNFAIAAASVEAGRIDWRREVGMVGDVEEFGAELDPGSFRERCLFADHKINIFEVRSKEDIPSCITVRPCQG